MSNISLQLDTHCIEGCNVCKLMPRNQVERSCKIERCLLELNLWRYYKQLISAWLFLPAIPSQKKRLKTRITLASTIGTGSLNAKHWTAEDM